MTPETRASLLLKVRDPSDQAAWREFFEIYEPVIRGMAQRRGLQDADAEDVTQQILLSVSQALAKRPHDSNRARFRTWLHRVVENAVLNSLQRARPDRGTGESGVLELLHQTEDSGDSDELRREYQEQAFRHAAVRIRPEFSESTWQSFWRSAVEGEDCAAIAADLGISVGSVYTARSRVMKRLREKVAEY
ncbi:MAG: sigma-70 family RNA polymerase sigma factor [Planctomycetaceae bacterium]|nr:sigma-70 family RNA polymerase sigma factor [Planctomycetaceae bacterium]